ncbi:hypothetical protein YC2023_010746 [Brassica napus]
MTKNGALGLVFPRRQSLNHGGYERLSWLRISTRKTETSGPVVRPRPWWLRFQLMAEEESRDGIGEQGRGREGGAVTWNVEKDLQSAAN